MNGAAQDRQVPWGCCPQFAPQNEHSSTCSKQSKDVTVGQAWYHISGILALKRWRQKTQGQAVLDSTGNSRSVLVIRGLVSNTKKTRKLCHYQQLQSIGKQKVLNEFKSASHSGWAVVGFSYPLAFCWLSREIQSLSG